MKKRTLSLFVIATMIFIGCGRKSNESEKGIPKALLDDASEIKSYRSSSNDLVEELYKELVEKSQELKNLEDSIQSIDPQVDKAKTGYSKYDSKSKDYYRSANLHADQISDSLLKKKIQGIITASNNRYTSRNSELSSLQDMISRNNASIGDYHAVLKIILTLPIIETYQKGNIPNPQEFKRLIKKQLELINDTKKLTPTY